MKIIVINDSSCNNDGKDTLLHWMSGVCMKADSALLKGGKPFFVPDYLGIFMAQVFWVIRLCRLGKSIPARFASRYYDGVTLGVNIYGESLKEQLHGVGGFADLAESLDGTAVIGDFLDVSAVHSKPLFEVNGNLPEGWQHQPGENSVLGVVDETVERLSKYMMLRQGDLLFVPALGTPFEISPDMHLEGRIGEKRVLEFNIK